MAGTKTDCTPPARDLFASPIITLHIGPKVQVLTAHKSTLTRVEYFSACLAPDGFIEGQTNTITLLEDDFDAMAQIIQYLSLGRPEDPSVKVLTPGKKDHCKSLTRLYLNTYIAPDKLCTKDLRNLLVDWFINYSKTQLFGVTCLHQLAKPGLGDSYLSKFLTEQLA